MKRLVIILFAAITLHPSLAGTGEIVKLSETYELANIILALTPYGKSDPWEVSQNSDYYRAVRKHFDKFDDHPLLERVNYSREKWDYYLSFRTDAYAFTFGKNDQLKRVLAFEANEGLNPFEENLDLINDFVKITGFREFYRANAAYYKQLANNYLESQHYDEMLNFLTKEFDQTMGNERYAIALSPLVGRMNCHRSVGGVKTDFITVPQFLLSGERVGSVSESDIATETHMLFTELDHGFVDPLTERYKDLVNDNFTVARWNNKSGYETDSLAVFNEYMTWAIFDVFVHQRFPSVAEEASANWALQNESRGFVASSLFNHIVLNSYRKRKTGQTIRDLYPEIIQEIGKMNSAIDVPSIALCDLDNQTVSESVVNLVIKFSIPMEHLETLDVAIATSDGDRNIVNRFEMAAHDLRWENGDTELHAVLKLERGKLNHIFFNYPWKTHYVVRSKAGVDLPPYSRIKITVNP